MMQDKRSNSLVNKELFNQVIKEGFLLKKGRGSKKLSRRNWKKRWCKLMRGDVDENIPNRIEYYSNQQSTKPKGIVYLDNCVCEVVFNRHHNEWFCFDITHVKEERAPRNFMVEDNDYGNEWYEAIQEVLVSDEDNIANFRDPSFVITMDQLNTKNNHDDVMKAISEMNSMEDDEEEGGEEDDDVVKDMKEFKGIPTPKHTFSEDGGDERDSSANVERYNKKMKKNFDQLNKEENYDTSEGEDQLKEVQKKRRSSGDKTNTPINSNKPPHPSPANFSSSDDNGRKDHNTLVRELSDHSLRKHGTAKRRKSGSGMKSSTNEASKEENKKKEEVGEGEGDGGGENEIEGKNESRDDDDDSLKDEVMGWGEIGAHRDSIERQDLEEGELDEFHEEEEGEEEYDVFLLIELNGLILIFT